MISKLYEQHLRRDIFRLSILTLATVIIWVGIATYRTLSKSEVKPRVAGQIQPLTAQLDLDTMENISKRRQAPLSAWENIERPELPEVLVIPEEPKTPEATESASPAGGSESAEE